MFEIDGRYDILGKARGMQIMSVMTLLIQLHVQYMGLAFNYTRVSRLLGIKCLWRISPVRG